MIALADGFYSSQWQIIRPGAWIAVNLNAGLTSDATRSAAQRHRRRLNVAFCDGHVETFRYEKLLLDSSEPMLAMWNNDNRPHTGVVRR